MERITPRYVFEARIRIHVRRASQDLVMEGWARDLSETGLSAFVARDLIAEEPVTLEIPFPPSRRVNVPAKVARCMGTQYGFQFTALSPDQRADIRSAVRNRPEIDAYDGKVRPTISQPHRQVETGLSSPKQETQSNDDSAFADRARALIKRGYTPKVAVELALYELEVEHGKTSQVMDRARVDAEDFLLKARRGVI